MDIKPGETVVTELQELERVSKLAALNKALSDGFSSALMECEAKLTERDAEVERLRAAVELREFQLGRTVIRAETAETKLTTLRAAADRADSDLACDEQHCWCFTRAAMRGQCDCTNCATWRLLRSAMDAIR